jgi:glycosyltransferase involved in cell wall biosynthesis
LTPSLSIVIPAYNEERRLGATLDRIQAYLNSRTWEFVEVVVVNDGSRDGTVALASGRPGVRVLANPGNRGKGYSVRHGVMEAAGEWTLVTDADLSTPIEEVEKLWGAAQRGADVAIGSRAVDRSLVGVHQPFPREAMGRVFNFLMRLVTALPFRDTQCGFKLFRASAAREIFKRQTLDGFGFDVEALFIARRLGYQVEEIAVRWDDVTGTKVSMWRGVKAFLDPLRVRWRGWRGKYR